MSESYEAATEVCGALEQIRQELDYIGRQLDNSDVQNQRERIAMVALAAILPWAIGSLERESVAVDVAISYADEMIEKLANTPEETKK